jgi:hypothetical protein
MPTKKLTTKQEAFVAAFIGAARGNATEAARMAGYRGSDNVLKAIASENLTKPDIATRIKEYRDQIEAEGLANLQNRLNEYNDRWYRMRQIRDERASDSWLADVPGGSTGLVVKQLKQVKHIREEEDKDKTYTVEVWESAVDTGYLREIRELEKHAAQDLGQWEDKSVVSGPGGAPLMVMLNSRPDGPD